MTDVFTPEFFHGLQLRYADKGDQGYDRDAVDEFLDLVEDALKRWDNNPRSARDDHNAGNLLTSEKARNYFPSKDSTRGGDKFQCYQKDDVQASLSHAFVALGQREGRVFTSADVVGLRFYSNKVTSEAEGLGRTTQNKLGREEGDRLKGETAEIVNLYQSDRPSPEKLSALRDTIDNEKGKLFFGSGYHLPVTLRVLRTVVNSVEAARQGGVSNRQLGQDTRDQEGTRYPNPATEALERPTWEKGPNVSTDPAQDMSAENPQLRGFSGQVVEGDVVASRDALRTSRVDLTTPQGPTAVSKPRVGEPSQPGAAKEDPGTRTFVAGTDNVIGITSGNDGPGSAGQSDGFGSTGR